MTGPLPRRVLLVGPASAATGALVGQVERLGAVPVRVDPDLPLQDGLGQVADDLPVVVLDSRACGHTHVLRRLLCDTRADVAVLAAGEDGPVGFSCSARARALLAEVAAAGEDVAGSAHALAEQAPGRGLTPARVPVGAFALGLFTGEGDRARMRAAFTAVERLGGEDALRRRESVKPHDNPVARYLLSPWTSRLAPLLVGRGVSPDAVTVASLVLAAAAAAAAAVGGRGGLAVALVLTLLSFALDCCDGQMARYAVRYSAIGAWLDIFGDRVKEQLLLVGLAVGAVGSLTPPGRHPGSAWWLAALVGAVTLTRAFVAFGYERARPSPGSEAAPPTRSWRRDLRRLAMLTYFERTTLMLVLAVLVGPQPALIAMAALGVPSIALLVAGRLRRARTEAAPDATRAAAVAATADSVLLAPRLRPAAAGAYTARIAAGSLSLVALPVAAGWVASALGAGPLAPSVLAVVAAVGWLLTGARHAATGCGPWAFLLPAATCAAEAAVLLAVAWWLPGDGRTAVTALVLVVLVTLHRYQVEYAAAPRLSRMAVGHETRLLIVAAAGVAAALTGSTLMLPAVFLALTALVLVRIVAAETLDLRAALRLRAARG